jgi:hypothetical protein
LNNVYALHRREYECASSLLILIERDKERRTFARICLNAGTFQSSKVYKTTVDSSFIMTRTRFVDLFVHCVLLASLFLVDLLPRAKEVALTDEEETFHSSSQQLLDQYRIATERIATPSPSPSSFHPSYRPTAHTASAVSAASSSLQRSFMIPVLSALSLAAVAIRTHTRRCTMCLDDIIFDDSPPQEIVITRTHTATTTTSSSAIGDRATDVELAPVAWTMTSHDWAEAMAFAAAPGVAGAGQQAEDAALNKNIVISRTRSADWIVEDQYSESVADFFHME